MTRQTKVRLCLALFILTATVGLTVLPAHDAYALPCCDQGCGYVYENCLARIAYPECNGDSACCANKESVCYSHCNPFC